MIPNRDVFNFEAGLAIVGHEVGRQLVVQPVVGRAPRGR
jgi:hypothetical protein